MRHTQFYLPLLAACVAVSAASAQPPRAAPAAVAPSSSSREPANASDAQLGLEVQARLYQSLDVSNLSALVQHGVATLDGSVGSEGDRQRAETIALEVSGVKSVVNELRVATPATIALANEAEAIAQRENTDLETAVATQLQSDAVLGSRGIRVEADELGNTVTLSGTVSTPDEKERAGQIAATAFPAGRVRNQLEVQQRL